MSTTRTESTTPDLDTQFDISALLANASKDVEPRVQIPAPIATFLGQEAAKFANRTNRFRRTLHTDNDALAKAILEYRPADQKLSGVKLHEAAAKEFARQLRQYATDHKLSPATDRDGSTVTYRLAKPRKTESANGPVTVTNVADVAESSKAGAESAMSDAANAAKSATE